MFIVFLSLFLSVTTAYAYELPRPGSQEVEEANRAILISQKIVTQDRCKYGFSISRICDEWITDIQALQQSESPAGALDAYKRSMGLLEDLRSAQMCKSMVQLQELVKHANKGGFQGSFWDGKLLIDENKTLFCLDANHATPLQMEKLEEVFFSDIEKRFPEQKKADPEIVREWLVRDFSVDQYRSVLSEAFLSTPLTPLLIPSDPYATVSGRFSAIPAVPFLSFRVGGRPGFMVSREGTTVEFDSIAVPPNFLKAYWTLVPELLMGGALGGGKKDPFVENDQCEQGLRALNWGAYFGIRATPHHFSAWQVSEENFQRWMVAINTLGNAAEMMRISKSCVNAFYVAYSMWPRIEGFSWNKDVRVMSSSSPELKSLGQGYEPGWKVDVSFLRQIDEKTGKLRWGSVVKTKTKR